MSALTDLFQSMANKIRSKTGTATTYTPPQMVADGIDDVFDAGVASATTPITPSNSSPVAMSANTGYKPTASGYAISSYVSKAPSNSMPPSLTAGDMCHIENNGYAVANITGVTPSDTSPVALSQNDICGINQNGYAIESQPTSITPSDSSPVALSNGTIYKAGGNGYAIESQVEDVTPSNTLQSFSEGTICRLLDYGYIVNDIGMATPSDSFPVSVSSGRILKSLSAGYLVKTVSNLGGAPDKTFVNNSAGSSGAVDISVTQKPRYIILGVWARGSGYQGMVGIIDVTKSQAYRMGYFSSAVSESWTGYTNYFTTISSTKVTYSYAGFGGNSRVQILMYY